MASIELLDRLRAGWKPPVEVLEHEPPRELVASKDIIRKDQLGRNVVVVPAGTVPANWVELTAEERASLLPPPESKPLGYLNPGPFGFSPEGVRVGYTIEHPE
jgi:hypothetical protein